MVGTMRVVKAGSGHATTRDTHADLPEHAFGSCAICTRRLLAQRPAARPAERSSGSRDDVPTRLLVQTSAVAAPSGRG